ncbi:MAG: hypothetical protein K0R25_1364 [Rickettsiaceae bacterium]|jgi:hypothetical protein|nr:hypothetical protein [Rickettsiaceae bacterium]
MSISDMTYQMVKSWRFYLIFILFFNVSLANAAGSEQYAVNGIVINAAAKSPAQARTTAIANGQRNAFVILLNRLGVDEKFAANFGDDAISDMVSSRQIIDEKIAGNNYSATLNLIFSESFVKHYLGDKTKFAEVPKAESYLIIPIKLEKQKSVLWEENNDWKYAFENIIKSKKTTSIKLPKGDVEDMVSFNSKNLNADNFTNFDAIAGKYKIDAIILTYFDFDSIENKVNITLKIIHKFQVNSVRLDFVNVSQLPLEELVNKVAAKTFDYIADLSKTESGESSQSGLISTNIDILVSNLDEWLAIKSKLEDPKIASSLKIISISKDMIKTEIIYNRSNGDIINFFAKKNLFLQKKSEGGYILSLTKNQTNQ